MPTVLAFAILYAHLPILLASGTEALSSGSQRNFTSKGIGFYPSYDDNQGGFVDCMDKPLYTLQDFLAGSVPWVDVAFDKELNLKYGLEVQIPELNSKYNRSIIFKVSDTGIRYERQGFSQVVIATLDRQSSQEEVLNGQLTLVFPKLEYGRPGFTACTLPEVSNENLANEGLQCPQSNFTYEAVGTGYYPANNSVEGGVFDCRDKPLYTLQAFLKDEVPWVDVAMDHHLKLKYGLQLCIPELNRKFKKVITFKVTDTGPSFANKGFSRIDICTETEEDTFDTAINGPLTLVFNNIELGIPGETACTCCDT